MTSEERRFVETGPRRTAFVLQGSGPGTPVLLLHPLAMSADFWKPVATHLALTRPVLSVDARGHGASSWDGDSFTIEDLAQDACDAVVSTYGRHARVAVAGMSMGGLVALSLALRHPARVDRLLLLDTTSSYGPGRIAAWSERARQAVAKPRIEQLDFQVPRWFSDEFVADHPDEVRRVSEIFVATDSDAHAAACGAMGSFDVTHQLSSIKVPAMVVVGEHDYATPPSMAKILAGGLQSASLMQVSGARHASTLERPDIWPEFDRFLDGVGPPA